MLALTRLLGMINSMKPIRFSFRWHLPHRLFAMAQAVKDREGAVRQDRATMEKDGRWLYNDFQRACRSEADREATAGGAACVPLRLRGH
jgi:hypothetical protein